MDGLLAATSRTYTLVGGTAATFGSTVPTLGISRTLRPGQTLRIGGLTDTTRSTIQVATPAALRTNFGLVEVAGEPIDVRVSVYFNDPRTLAAGRPIGSKIFSLSPRGFLSVSNMVSAVVGPSRETLYGDLSGVMVQFEVVSETGALFVYTSSIDNGTGDSILRTE